MEFPHLRFWIVILLLVLGLPTYEIVESLLAKEPPGWRVLLRFVAWAGVILVFMSLSPRFRKKFGLPPLEVTPPLAPREMDAPTNSDSTATLSEPATIRTKNPYVRYWTVYLLAMLVLLIYVLVESRLAGDSPAWNALIFMGVSLFVILSALLLSKRFRQYLHYISSLR
jgi:hypothetical protein